MATSINRVEDGKTGRGEGEQVDVDTERVAYIWHDMGVRGSSRGASEKCGRLSCCVGTARLGNNAPRVCKMERSTSNGWIAFREGTDVGDL